MNEDRIPRDFWWRRLHSLTGLGLVIFLGFHLFTNAQAGIGSDDGRGYILAVNHIQELPFLRVFEWLLIGLPLIIHSYWGLCYLKTGQMNSFGYDGKHPYLPEYERNHAYTWQRITSWILLFGIIFHVLHMRVLEYPEKGAIGSNPYYVMAVTEDPALPTLAARLGIDLYDKEKIESYKKTMIVPTEGNVVEAQQAMQEEHFTTIVERNLQPNQVVAVSKSFGGAELMMVRETFKNPWMMLIYTIFVLAACFHAFNGLWTFMITWGVTLTVRSQRLMLKVSTFLMFIVTFLGLAAIYGTYLSLRG